jgi:hypothetical protein
MEQEKPISLYRFKILRAIDGFRFLNYIIRTSNALF